MPTTEPFPAKAPLVISGAEAARGDNAGYGKYQAEQCRTGTVRSAVSGKRGRCCLTSIRRFVSSLYPTSIQNKISNFSTVAASRAPLPPDAASSRSVNSISDRIIGCALIVWETLGAGLPEIIYENALAHELRKEGLAVCQQEAVPVYYDYMIVGDYMADLLVEKTVMVELRAIDGNSSSHLAECQNYLKATGLDLCLLVTFGTSRLTMRRVVKGA